jgi:single-strand DNA-binding protein
MLNKVLLIGNLGQDPEERSLENGTEISRFSLATSETYKDRNGEKVEKTEWHKVVAFGKTAEVCNRYLTKGSQVHVEGKIQTRRFTDKEGVERYMTEIILNNLVMLGKKGSSNNTSNDGAQGDLYSSKGAAREQQEDSKRTAGGQQGSSDLNNPNAEDDLPF